MFTNQMSKIFIVLLVVSVALVSASYVVRSTPPSADLSYESVEQVRFSRSLATNNLSYDRVENIRA